jgi:type II secretory pathway component PulJ
MGILMGISLSLAVAIVAFLVYRNTFANPGDFSELNHELNLAIQLMRRDISSVGVDNGGQAEEAGMDAPPVIERPAAVVIDRKNDCVFFEFDRNRDGQVGKDEYGAYRREVVGGIGVIALWMGEGAPDCGDPSPWAPVSDASVIDINTFSIANGQSSRQPGESLIHLRLGGRLVSDLDNSQVVEASVEVPHSHFL